MGNKIPTQYEPSNKRPKVKDYDLSKVLKFHK